MYVRSEIRNPVSHLVFVLENVDPEFPKSQYMNAMYALLCFALLGNLRSEVSCLA